MVDDVRRSCASTASRCSPSASTCARPSSHLPVVRYWHPDEFDALEAAAYELGFESRRRRPARAQLSYHADQHVPQPQPGVGPLAASA